MYRNVLSSTVDKRIREKTQKQPKYLLSRKQTDNHTMAKYSLVIMNETIMNCGNTELSEKFKSQ